MEGGRIMGTNWVRHILKGLWLVIGTGLLVIMLASPVEAASPDWDPAVHCL